MRAGYMFSEVVTGLRRNVTMTIAMILTTGISLGLLGGGLIIARMTDKMKEIFGDKVEVTIYLTSDQSRTDPNCTDAICADLLKSIQNDVEVERVSYETQAQAYERYKAAFANQPELLDIGSADALPASMHVTLKDPERYQIIIDEYSGKPGVDSVSDQSAFLERLFSLLNGLRNATIVVAIVQAVAAFLLISNMVQIAAYTRRTETEIMRLVGASRWRTQLPFIIEAVVAGIIGAVLALGGLIAAKIWFIDDALGAPIRAGILPAVDESYFFYVGPILGAVGAGLAAISAYFTLRLYVRL
ncbi:ABC transporter permease [Nakamurella antarctica]|uniref:Cell division protein FtsX n=1 Tax=Nakamurella antarctica TaxID=1902245 RepID=A0A3G8ZMI1_9ACTN|nr:permease-like cell division protein FtsX [Nakamurella antarctica]AZI58358.1 ABC transporter permease [Nakamurella antarctica]